MSHVAHERLRVPHGHARRANELMHQQRLGWPLPRGSVPEPAAPMDHAPVVKLFTPDAACTWLLTELDPDGRTFGLCDLGFGEPERDLDFQPDKPLSAYTEEAQAAGHIVA